MLKKKKKTQSKPGRLVAFTITVEVSSFSSQNFPFLPFNAPLNSGLKKGIHQQGNMPLSSFTFISATGKLCCLETSRGVVVMVSYFTCLGVKLQSLISSFKLCMSPRLHGQSKRVKRLSHP